MYFLYSGKKFLMRYLLKNSGIVGVQKNGGSFIYDELQKYIICLDQVKLIFLM